MRLSRRSSVIGFLSLFLLAIVAVGSILIPSVSSAAVSDSLAEVVLQTPTESIRRLSMTTNDIIYNPANKMLYASIPSKAGNIGNSLTQINPRTGEIGSSVYIGSEPNKLALSADNQTMYVVLDGAYAVRQFNAATQTPGPQFSSGRDQNFYPYQIYDLKVAPNDPNLVAITRSALQTTTSFAVYKNGFECPQTELPHKISFNSLAFSASGSMLYGTEGSLMTSMNINGAGTVSITSTTPLTPNPSLIKIDNGLIFTSGGQVINANTGTLLGTFPGVYSHTFVSDVAVGRAYYAVTDYNSGNLKINTYDINTFALVGSVIIPNYLGAPRYLVRWGANGLALGTWENQLFLIQTSLIPSSEPIPTPSPTPTVTPSPTPTPFAAFTRQLSLPTNDLIYNRETQKLYASVPSRAGNIVGNTVTAIDTESGTLGNSILVGSEPGKIAFSDDSKTMYVGLNGAGSIRRVDLVTQMPGLLFSLGTSADGAYAPLDIAVKPGAAGTLAVLRKYNEIAVYDEGVQNALNTSLTGLASVVFGSPNVLYSNSLYGIFKYSVTASGLSHINTFSGSSDDDLYFENGLIYMTSGMVVDAETGSIKGTFSGLHYTTAMAIDTANNRAFFLTNLGSSPSGFVLRAYELDTFRFVGSLDVQGTFYGSAQPILVRWGENGLAYRDDNDKLFLLQTSLVSPSAPVPTATPTVTPTPTPSPAYISTFVRKVNLPVRDIVYNEPTQSIYASVPGAAGANRGNSVTQISPTTGEIGSSVVIGGEPNKLALADDGRTLYAGLDAVNAIRRLDVVSQTPGLQFTPGGEVQYFRDMAVLPGKPESIAVVNNEGAIIFDNGIRRPKIGANGEYSIIKGIQFSSASTLYGLRENGGHGLVKYTLDNSGITEVNSTRNMFPGHDVDIKLADGLLYSTHGRVVEPETPKLIGTFHEGGTSMAVDPALGRVFYMSGNVLSAYDAKTFLKIGSVSLPILNGVARKSLVRWGVNGLAVLTFSNPPNSNVRELYLIQSELISAAAPVPTGLQLKAADNIYENSQNATVTVTRTGDLSSATTVNYTTGDGTAKAGSDYTAVAAGSITFAAGETSKNILIPLLNDNVYEDQESFIVTLSNPTGSNVQLLSSDAVVTINNEDPKPIISASNVIVQEPRSGSVEAVFTVRLSNPTSQTVTVNYLTGNGTASAGSDYLATSGVLTFNPLETTKTISVVINADVLNEGNETFFLILNNAANTVNTTAQVTGTIRNTVRRQLYDFDGDNKTDISIFRPSVGEWWYLKSSNGGNGAFQFGSSSDKLVPADYTGDGKTDIAFFRPSSGEWFILRSEDNSFYAFPFGASGDVPAPADYDGDGKSDPAVFRPSNTTWYVSKSTGGTIIQTFGQTGDIPVVADYDGDGKSDIAIYRSGAGEWWINRSSQGGIVFQFGNSTDKPLQGDYTGDGKADVAFFRPSTGEWFVLRSENLTYYSFPFGTSGDLPSPGDYDGDGKSDAAVFRPSNNTWYVQRSTAGTLIQTFGQTGDTPVPSAFVP